MVSVIYLIKIEEYNDNLSVYSLFEAHTQSFFRGGSEDLHNMLNKSKVGIQNVKLVNNQLIIKKWINGVRISTREGSAGPQYMLLCQTRENQFKLVTCNGIVKYENTETLKRYAKENKITNCGIKDGKIEYIGTYKATKNTQFEEQIAEKYRIYITKTALLGNKMSFIYSTEGEQVKLIKYTGVAKDVIIPKFITTIMDRAFQNCKINSLKLDSGIKYIGGYAFEGCNLSEVIIPDTVELICSGAFFGNKKLLAPKGEYMNSIKILSSKTKIII